MIFYDEKYKSKYDLWSGEKVSFNYNELAKEIKRVVDLLQEDLVKGYEIQLKYKDNNQKKMSLKKTICDDVYCRTESRIVDVIKRKDKTSISNYLKQWNVEEPTNDLQKEKYMRLLYLFYMVQYVLFPEEANVLRKRKEMSTDFSPIPNASKGKYYSFILNSLLEYNENIVFFQKEFSEIEKSIYSLDFTISEVIREDSPFIEELPIAKAPIVINEILKGSDKLKEKIVCNEELSDVYYKIIDYILKQYYLSYANEIIINCSEEKEQFIFEESEEKLRNELKTERFRSNDIAGCLAFLNNAEVKKFCMRGTKNHYPNSLDNFICNIFEYDIMRYDENGIGLFFEKSADNYYISGAKLAVIARTFYDLGASRKYRTYLERNKIEYKTSYRKNLVDKYCSNIALTLFCFAYISEMYMLSKGSGAYAMFFVPLILEKNILIQKIIENAFEYHNLIDRLNYFNGTCECVKSIKQKLEMQEE